MEDTLPAPNEILRDFLKDDAKLSEITNDLTHRFHQLLNTTSGVMAAGIVLSGGSPGDLSREMQWALLCFILSLVAGLAFLHFLYLAHARHRHKRAAALAALLDPPVAKQPTQESGESPGDLAEELGHMIVPMPVGVNAARIAQIVLVFSGFGLVLWSLSENLL